MCGVMSAFLTTREMDELTRESSTMKGRKREEKDGNMDLENTKGNHRNGFDRTLKEPLKKWARSP